MNKFKRLMIAISLTSSLVVPAVTMADVDPALQDYVRASGVSGNLSSIGSDTLNNLMTLWAEEFAKYYPNVNVQIQGAGSSTAPPALTEGTAMLAPMSRPMRQSEIQEFEARHGYQPTELPVAVDMLAVYVNRDNPIESLSLPQVDAIFSATRRCGAPADIQRWGDLGLTGDWENRDFTLYSRNAVSGTMVSLKTTHCVVVTSSPALMSSPVRHPSCRVSQNRPMVLDTPESVIAPRACVRCPWRQPKAASRMKRVLPMRPPEITRLPATCWYTLTSIPIVSLIR